MECGSATFLLYSTACSYIWRNVWIPPFLIIVVLPIKIFNLFYADRSHWSHIRNRLIKNVYDDHFGVVLVIESGCEGLHLGLHTDILTDNVTNCKIRILICRWIQFSEHYYSIIKIMSAKSIKYVAIWIVTFCKQIQT